MSLLFPIGMAALGALVPLLALYLLKQKRIEMKVPTNFLWAKAMEDLRASSLFQRLRATLLLLLQAASIVLFALAAAGASLDLDTGDTPRHVIVLLDRSASMQARDEGEGRTRFDAARELAQRVVDGLAPADEMMIVAFDQRAEVAAAFTGDKERLGKVLDDMRPRDLPTKIAEALMLAVSFAQASKGFDTEIQVLSDGAIEEELPPVPYPVTFVKLGTSGANQGIATLQVLRTPGEAPQVFVHVENGHTEPVTRNVTLRRGTTILDARALTLPAAGGGTAVFTIAEPETKAAESRDAEILTVALDSTDVLAADDKVELVLRPSVPRTGLLVAAEPTIWLDPDKVRRLHPGLSLTRVTMAEALDVLGKTDLPIDFVCFDGEAPAALPPVAAQMYIDCVPPGSGLVRGAKQEYPIVVDWDRTHPATARCQFDDLLVTESAKLGGAERSRVLIDSTGGPLALLTPVPGREVVVLAFSPGNSNFPLKLSWPLFLANTLDFLLNRTEREGEEPVSKTGASLVIQAATTVRITSPSGSTLDAEPDAKKRVTFAATHESGVYRAMGGQGAEEVRARALLDSSEIRIAPRDTLVVGGEKLAAVARPAQRNVLLRDPLLLAALGVLLLEWALWCSRR